MHTFLAAFFSAMFSFCHASSVHHASVKANAFWSSRDEVAYNIQYAPPSRHEFAQAQFQRQARGGYAEGECFSCRKMNAVYYTR